MVALHPTENAGVPNFRSTPVSTSLCPFSFPQWVWFTRSYIVSLTVVCFFSCSKELTLTGFPVWNVLAFFCRFLLPSAAMVEPIWEKEWHFRLPKMSFAATCATGFPPQWSLSVGGAVLWLPGSKLPLSIMMCCTCGWSGSCSCPGRFHGSGLSNGPLIPSHRWGWCFG